VADNKSKTGAQDRAHISASDHFEIAEIANKFSLSVLGVHDLIKRFGNERETLEQEARKLAIRLAAEQDYEALVLSARFGISMEQASDLVKRYGNNRAKLDQEADKLTR